MAKLATFKPFSLFLLDLGSGTLTFSDMNHFLSVKDDKRLSHIISSTSCLITVAKTDSTEDISQLIDFMNGINVKDKHLQVHMSSDLESNVLANKSINFNVVVQHLTSGAYDCKSAIN